MRLVVNLPIIQQNKVNWNMGKSSAAMSLQNLFVINIVHRKIKQEYVWG